MLCVSTHKVNDSGVMCFDASLLAASASEQPASLYTDGAEPQAEPTGFAAQPFETDTEYVITIEQVPPAPAAAAPAAAPTPVRLAANPQPPEQAAVVPPRSETIRYRPRPRSPSRKNEVKRTGSADYADFTD